MRYLARYETAGRKGDWIGWYTPLHEHGYTVSMIWLLFVWIIIGFSHWLFSSQSVHTTDCCKEILVPTQSVPRIEGGHGKAPHGTCKGEEGEDVKAFFPTWCFRCSKMQEMEHNLVKILYHCQGLQNPIASAVNVVTLFELNFWSTTQICAMLPTCFCTCSTCNFL